jgi:UTP-glucose-1-phosphate uridylyltransferase
MVDSFGGYVRELRERKGLSLAQLGRELECSAPRLWKIEAGQERKRALPLHFLQRLCDCLAQQDSEITKLFTLAGYTAPDSDDLQRIIRIVQDTLTVPEFQDASNELVAEIQTVVTSWRARRRSRLQNVTKVVVAAAGWQPRLLSLNRFERTLLPAVDEAARAGITEVILVVPPSTPNLQLLRSCFPDSTIICVVQQEPLGLGNAILTAKQYIEGGPFGLILADEIDESRNALRNLVKMYEDIRKPLVGVDTFEPEDSEAVLRYYGFARTGERVRQNTFALESELIEKPRVRPGENHLRIAGRYVLVPEILQALQNVPDREPGPVKHDLTAAINQFWRTSASVLAYKLSRPMLSIAPYRYIIQSMDRSRAFAPETYRRVANSPNRRSSTG